jgi:hypothetical protein
MSRRQRIRSSVACAATLLGVIAVLAAAAAGASALTLSPLNGMRDASPSTQISFLGVPAGEIADVSVVGSRSGAHSGRLRSYASATGASFLPTHAFSEGERVSVSALVGRKGHGTRVGTAFTVAQLVHPAVKSPGSPPPAKAGANQSFVSAPQLQPPSVKVTRASPATASGDIFLTADSGRGQAGAMIIDGSGRLVWFQPAPKGEQVTNLQVERYENRPVLVYWQGLVEFGVGFGTDEMYGSDYRRIGAIGAGNGYLADLHELQITPQGSAFLTAYSLVRADLSSVGGPRDGQLQDSIVQEVDVKTGLVMFEWHAYGHVLLQDSYLKVTSSVPWDFFHVNSISLDPSGDGNFLISSRNTWAAYEIDHHAGAILWRIGGKHPSLRMGSGTGTAWQHDARWQPDHTLTIFDNGAVPKAHSQSRAIHERIDFAHRKVTLLSRYLHSPSLLSGSQGDDQVLPNGDSFVGWGELPYFSEFSPSGQLLFDAHLPRPAQIYRAFRFPWNGTPTTPPSIAVKAASSTAVTVYASWNGATNVASWRVLGGASPATLTPLVTVPVSGFETAIAVSTGAPDFVVQALGAAGELLGTSHVTQR